MDSIDIYAIGENMFIVYNRDIDIRILPL